tara:strand:+ start:249 stop:536 length:288 start_codon:yes stop_codon:yes gene_type:complete
MPGTHKKSSPLYKGIGKYKKKAKGKRGFKMKSPLRNEEVKTVGGIEGGVQTITKSKKGKSSEYRLISTQKNYQGSGKTVQIYENEEGNRETRVVS